MSATANLLAGMAAHLAATGVGTWRPDGVYQPDDPVPITIAGLPDAPDKAVALTYYTVTDDPSLSDSVAGVQVRCRGGADPRDVLDVDDAVFDQLHGLTDADLGAAPNAVRVSEILRNSSVPLGRDSTGRWEHVSNYYVTVWRPSPHRT